VRVRAYNAVMARYRGYLQNIAGGGPSFGIIVDEEQSLWTSVPPGHEGDLPRDLTARFTREDGALGEGKVFTLYRGGMAVREP
jgi:hypothetical protein